MHFQSPQQLLDVFAQLEEQNLFLIQNCQETEEALEELRSKYRETKTRMDTETDNLEQQIQTLKEAIKSLEDKGKALKAKTNEDSDRSRHETSLEDLSQKVAEVYQRSSFDNDASIGTLQMLTNIEARLEENLAFIDQMDQDFVEHQEKGREKERR